MSALPTGWTSTRGESIFEYVRGVTYQKQQARDASEVGYTGILRATNIQDGHLDRNNLVYVPSDLISEKQALKLGDQVIASSSGSKSVVGKAAPVSDEIVGLSFGAFCAVARPRSEDIRDWIRLFFKSPEYRQFVNDTAMGNNINNLRSSDLIAIDVPLAPLFEQRRIVAKVDGLTTGTARARKELDRIPTLIARYKSAVLAFAFSGRLTKDWRIEMGRDALGAGEYPKGWSVRELEEISEIQGGIQVGKKRPASAELVEVPYLRVANVQRGWLNLNEIKTLEVTTAERARLLLADGDILMNEGGDRDKLGRGWVWRAQIPECIHQNHVFRIRLHDRSLPPEYVSHYANENGQQYFIDQGTQTTNLASISKRKVAALPVPVPPTDEAVEIVRRIESAFGWLDRVAADHATAARLLPKLDAAILAKAFRGELVPQDPNDEPASRLLERIKAEGEAEGKEPRRGRGRKPTGSKEQLMTEKALPPRDRLLKDSEKWPAVGLPFEAIAMRNTMPHDALRDALFELLSDPSPALQQRFDTDAEVMVIQRVAA